MSEAPELKLEQVGSERVRPDRIKPLMGAFVSFLLFRIVLVFIEPLIEFLGGKLMGITLGILLSAALSSALAMTIFESRRLSDLGLHWREGTRNNLLIGTGLGLFSAALVVLVPVAFGMARFVPMANPDLSLRGALFMPILLFCGAMGEELAFRGFALQYLTRGWGPWAALLSTGALFGIMHDGNPGATWLSGVNTAAFGILFGFALLRSRDLWFPIGMHFGWNVALPFLGVELSGLTIRVTGYELVWKSSDLWSGGKYGPEAGLLASAIIAILFVAVWKIPINRGHAWLLDAPEESEGPEPRQSALPPS
jgi:membrane protease YdiL (CAAX protease family)